MLLGEPGRKMGRNRWAEGGLHTDTAAWRRAQNLGSCIWSSTKES